MTQARDEKAVERERRIAEIVQVRFPRRAVVGLEQMKTGIMHLNYIVMLDDGSKVFYRGHNLQGPANQEQDLYFGDPVSLDRENAIMDHLRRTNVPVPEVYAFEEGPLGRYLLLSVLPGIHLRQYLEDNGHKLEVFFGALRKIGRTLASTRRVTFEEFGSIQPDGVRNGRRNFADRLADILLRHEFNLHVRHHFCDEEWAELQGHIARKLDAVRARFGKAVPQIVIYDLHARNFNVHQDGERAGDLSGAFDVEFAQAAHPSLEWGSMNVQLFCLYGMKWFDRAKKEFLSGYAEGGGDAGVDPALEETYLVNHALSAVAMYDGAKDGLRDEWSAAFKQWSLDIARGQYDPSLVTEITRPLTKIPRID